MIAMRDAIVESEVADNDAHYILRALIFSMSSRQSEHFLLS